MSAADRPGGFQTEASEDARCRADAVFAFKREVEQEIAREGEIVRRLKVPPRWYRLAHPVVLLLIPLSLLIILYVPYLLFYWLVISILLYSYNFIILLLPTTTTEKVKIKERVDIVAMYNEVKELVVHLLGKRRLLAVEMGLTVFLGGMVPLALSFTIIFGIAAILAGYFSFVTAAITVHLGTVIISQILLILLFYGLMIILQPQSQGITRIARYFKIRLSSARSEGRVALTVAVILAAALVGIGSVLSIGAILLPGGTLLDILDEYQGPIAIDWLGLAAVFALELAIMRHFQGVSSRRMALSLLEWRIGRMKAEVVAPLKDWIDHAGHTPEDARYSEPEQLKRIYYSIAVYDIVEQNFFGFAPIYTITPRIRYIHDESALTCVMD